MRVLSLAAVLIVASTATVLLISSARTQSLRVHGTLSSSYFAAYDILVRPRGARTPLERRRGLVEDNYLSGLFGGITMGQLRTVRSIRYVDIAAPVANIGFVFFPGQSHVSLDDVVDNSPFQLYRIRDTLVEQQGTTHIPMNVSYLFYTTLPFQPRSETVGTRQRYRGVEYKPCDGGYEFYKKTGHNPPFGISCLSRASPGRGDDYPLYGVRSPIYPKGKVSHPETMGLPTLVAAIDPVAEARLVGLDRAVTAGRYLRAHERAAHRRWYVPPAPGVPHLPYEFYYDVPMLVSSRTFVDAEQQSTVERLRIPPGVNVPKIMSTAQAVPWLERLRGEPVATRGVGAQRAYHDALNYLRYCHTQPACNPFFPVSHWTASPPTYRGRPSGHLMPEPVVNPPSIWTGPATGIGPSQPFRYVTPPNRDVQFRRLRGHLPVSAWYRVKGRANPGADYHVVGTFDPARLASFSPLSQVPLETYYPPTLLPVGAGSRAALGGRPLLPSMNVGDYVAQPPLLLTTLEAMRPFFDRHSFLKRTRDPIGVIRVRVKGSHGPADAQRIRLVAAEIHRRTGLDVDITAGSSPHPMLIDLSRGRFGRPPLTLREGWSQKGVSLAFLSALDRKTTLLTILIPLVAAFVLANGVAAIVRSRRRELGVLVCLGWPRNVIFASIVAEVVAVGVVAAFAATALAGAVVALTSLRASPLALALVGPVALGLAGVAALVPAARAAALRPVEAVEHPVGGAGRRRDVRRLFGLALVNVRRLPARTLPTLAALAAGVAALMLLLAIQTGFGGSLLDTVLGNAISLQVHGLDYAAVALLLILAVAGIADLLLLSLHERAVEFATLRSVGWDERKLRLLVANEALLLGLVGAAAGVAIGVFAGALLALPFTTLAVTAVTALVGGLMLTLAASLLAIARIGRTAPPAVLAND